MNDNQVFPFERNRYYAGKMLTSTDFRAEQIYMNNKRRFLNQNVLGAGIICGLSVLNLDELSILIESGAAIDELGREITVGKTIVRKLSAIDGFERLTGNKALLCLRYREEEVHPVYSIEHQEEGREYENNRIREGYELFLMDALSRKTLPDVEFLLEDILLKQKDYCIKVRIPSIVCRGTAVKLEVVAEKLSAVDEPFSMNAVFQLPMFTTQENLHELEVKLCNITLEQGAVMIQEYWLNTECMEVAETNILLKRGSVYASIGTWESREAEEIHLKIAITDMQPEEVVIQETGKPSLEMRAGRHMRDAVYLAEFTLMRTEAAYLIEKITEHGVKKYIATPAEAHNRSRYAAYYREAGIGSAMKQHQRTVSENSLNREADREADRDADREADWEADRDADWKSDRKSAGMPVEMSSGSLEIPLQMNMKKGDICYSHEVMHGLGIGNVYVEAGIAYSEEDTRTGKKAGNTIYGESALFNGQELMGMQTAVRVCNDRGCFQVAAKLLGEQRSIVLLVHWVAIKFKSEEERHLAEDHTGMSIVPETPTVRMGMKESHCFRVCFQNMEPCRVSYELTERGSGEISADGIYTAPTTGGVYEIHIRCTDIPDISTYAYAIVSK